VRWWWCGLVLLAGCLRLAGFHAKCAEDSDCPEGNVCEAQFCVETCVELPDSCPSGETCVLGHCQKDGTCSGDSQCGEGNICADGNCVAGCRHFSDCDFAHDMGCIDSVCQPAKLCLQQSECAYPQICYDSVCQYARCGGSSTLSCPGELRCQGGHCVKPAAATDCGGPGQSCCAGFQCNNGCCAMTAIGAFACIPDGASCKNTQYTSCVGSTGVCGSCGGLDQLCCSSLSTGDRWCSTANAFCDAGTFKCRACGDQGHDCCPVTSSISSGVDPYRGCNEGLTCRASPVPGVRLCQN